LAEAGALGATSGTVVHLARRPSADPASIGVLAHELTHARQPIGRPRFLLHAPSGAADADERTAHAVGNRMHAAASGIAGGGGDTPDGIAGLIGGGSVGSSGTVGSGGVGSAIGGGMDSGAVGGSSSSGRPMAMRVARSVSATSPTGSAFGGAASNAAGGAVRDQFSETAGAVSAGVVDRLPVGGAAVVGAATPTLTASEHALGGAATDIAGGAASTVDNATAQRLLSALAATTGEGAVAQGIGAAEGSAEHAAAGAVSGAGRAAGQAAGHAGGAAAGHLESQDVDRIVDAVEQRLLRQLERRGGRYAGVF
jgi:hypothetical protein